MGEVIVTKHAARRWRERVNPCSWRQAKAEILSHSKAIMTAAEFGAELVKLPTRHRLVIAGMTVVTVKPDPRAK